MNTMKKILMIMVIIGISSLGLVYCSNKKQDLSVKDRNKISDIIRQRNQDLLKAWASPDAFNKWMALYTDEKNVAWVKNPQLSNSILLIINEQLFDTKNEIETKLRAMVESRASTNIIMTKEYIAVLSATQVLHVGKFKFTVTSGKGVTSDEYWGTATTLWTLENNEWKILHYHQSSGAYGVNQYEKLSSQKK